MREKNYLFKQRLLKGETLTGIFLVSGNSMVAEACATLPIDWLMVDMEAGFCTKQDVLHIYQALSGTRVSPMVRIWEKNKHAIEFALDSGSAGVMVPKIDTGQDAAEVSSALYYPPRGTRGVNPVRASNYFEDMPHYFAHAHEGITGIVQIESAEAVDNCQSIAAVPGIDVLFIGCGDLASSYNQAGNVEGPLMDNARRAVLKACSLHNKVPGIFAYSTQLAVKYIREGFRFVAIGNDIKFLKDGLNQSLATIQQNALQSA